MTGGKAVIFSAPSGSGKTTIVKHLLTKFPGLQFSISATTRVPRNNEVDGKDYYFLKPDDFRKKIKDEQLLEWEEVYENTFYGTLQDEVNRIWSSGNHVVFDVDVKGGLTLKQKLGAKALAVFVKVSDIKILEERLKERGSESAESLKKRIDKAKYESSFENKFDVSLVNDNLESVLRKAEFLVSEFLGDQ